MQLDTDIKILTNSSRAELFKELGTFLIKNPLIVRGFQFSILKKNNSTTYICKVTHLIDNNANSFTILPNTQEL